ncbi:hypothetical protein EK21DRAFT_118078 [Setomelanomma holmii]|uniref:ubiquitinyl hydrolase 1 n=1 Tax=Setomelanomma holmii TaxID=210430 RepID=A0A9P4GY30_9PLEO|nr:hypothetical protein EK21DRAFT_118078 [Setomelanomma holmii]
MPRSEFSQPDVVLILTTVRNKQVNLFTFRDPLTYLVLTSLTYYYSGLSDDDFLDAFTHVLNSDQSEIEYGEWVRTAGSLPRAFHRLQGVNIKNRHQCVTNVFPWFRFSKGTIDYFLSHLVFVKEMKAFPYKLSASGWDIGAVKEKPTTGFSDTNDSTRVTYFLLDESSVSLIPPRSSLETSDAERLLKIVNQMEKPTRVILDVGAQILELNNYQVADTWLRMSDPSVIKAVVFFTIFSDDEELSVLDHSGCVELLQMSVFAKHLDVCLVYLDEAHTQGTNLKLPTSNRAAVPLGANLTKDRLVQACMRMRKLGKGQSVVFCIPEEIQAKILERTSKKRASDIAVVDIMTWAITETWADLQRTMPLWAMQGRRFAHHSRLVDSGDTTVEYARQFLENEAQSIESRYLPRSHLKSDVSSLAEGDNTNTIDTHIHKRYIDFGVTKFSSATL